MLKKKVLKKVNGVYIFYKNKKCDFDSIDVPLLKCNECDKFFVRKSRLNLHYYRFLIL